ncbi:hypothetical protein ACLQ29_21820 [Micromonospora sp. DT228]|uniref:hypothetical protein n=1 Tax=Micromonospora sp. DT228 TaxID=3393443 RepID=UPI003CF65ED8
MTTYPAKKKNGNLGAVGIAAAISVLLCCGVGTIGALTDDDSDKKPVAVATATASTVRDRIVDNATVTASPTPSAEASTTPSPALIPTPGPQRTIGAPTSRPVAKPTTSKPKAKATTPAPKPKTTAPKPKATTTAPKPKPTTAKPKPPAVSTVHPGAFCSTQGARGVTKTGKPMVCTTTATDAKKRWRAA